MDEKQTSQPGKLYTIYQQQYNLLYPLIILLCIYLLLTMILGTVLAFLLLHDSLSSVEPHHRSSVVKLTGGAFWFVGILPLYLLAKISFCIRGKKIQTVSGKDSLNKFIQDSCSINIPMALFKYGELKHFAGDTFMQLTLSGDNTPEPPTVEPVKAQFEPLLLSNKVSNDTVSSNEKPEAASEKQRQSPEQQTAARLKGGIVLLCFFLLFSIPFLLDTKEGVDPAFWVWPAIFIICCFLLIFTFKSNRYALPGGLLIQKARFKQKKWTLQRFDRRECVTFISMNEKKGTFYIHMINTVTRERTKFTLSKHAFESFLSVWLSPLPTPSLEEMSDFT